MTIKEAWAQLKFTAHCGNPNCPTCKQKIEAVTIIEKALFGDEKCKTKK